MEKMFKITRGDFVRYVDKYSKAEKLFRRIARRKYPCGQYTRLYFNDGAGFKLSMMTSKGLENSLKFENTYSTGGGSCIQQN